MLWSVGEEGGERGRREEREEGGRRERKEGGERGGMRERKEGGKRRRKGKERDRLEYD